MEQNTSENYMKPENWWFVDVFFRFQRGFFSSFRVGFPGSSLILVI